MGLLCVLPVPLLFAFHRECGRKMILSRHAFR